MPAATTSALPTLLGTIRDSSAVLLDRDVAVTALLVPTMLLLRRDARGESVPDDDLKGVLEAAQRLQDQLGFSALTGAVIG
jgi:hypothetical protein